MTESYHSHGITVSWYSDGRIKSWLTGERLKPGICVEILNPANHLEELHSGIHMIYAAKMMRNLCQCSRDPDGDLHSVLRVKSEGRT
jgi:hypothetical protein